MATRPQILTSALLLAAAWMAWSVPARPAALRIVSLAPHLTELAYAAGAGDYLVATVEYSDHPAAARELPRLGDAFQVDVERLLATRPDVVLAWEAGTRDSLIARLEALGLHVVIFSTFDIEDVGHAIRRIGKLAGTSPVADQAADRFVADIAELRQRYSAASPLSVFIQIDDRPLYTVNGRQLISQVVALCGGRNVFADLDQLAPAIGIESVIAADPEVIVSTDDPAGEAIRMWHAWPGLKAVRRGQLYSLRADDVTRPTIRLTAGIREVCSALDAARASKPAE